MGEAMLYDLIKSEGLEKFSPAFLRRKAQYTLLENDIEPTDVNVKLLVSEFKANDLARYLEYANQNGHDPRSMFSFTFTRLNKQKLLEVFTATMETLSK